MTTASVPCSPQWLDQDELATWIAFWETSHLVQQAIESDFVDNGLLTQVRYEILSRLEAEPDGSMRMSDLAARTVTSLSGLSYQVAQLERLGLVRRKQSVGDERGVVANITAAGVDLLKQAAPRHVDLVRRLFIDAFEPEEQRILVELLDRVRIRAQSARASRQNVRRRHKPADSLPKED